MNERNRHLRVIISLFQLRAANQLPSLIGDVVLGLINQLFEDGAGGALKRRTVSYLSAMRAAPALSSCWQGAASLAGARWYRTEAWIKANRMVPSICQ